MLRIALTGNIASGKSTVQKILEEHGYKVLDTDKTAHLLLDNSIDTVKEAFPACIENGTISRTKLGKIVFSDKNAKEKLESIIHPEIRKRIEVFFAENSGEKAVFVGIPLLFEANMTDLFDKILLIYTDDVIREKRLILRNKYSLHHARLRMNAQMPQNEKKLLSDYVILNNGTVSDLETAVSEFLSEIKPE